MEVHISRERVRGCGYRTSGSNGVGIYLIGRAIFEPCERLPFPLAICPTCGGGIKFSRGFTWIEPGELFHRNLSPQCDFTLRDHDHYNCLMCALISGSHGLLWIGARYYTVHSFAREAREMGVSKKLASVPRDFVFGDTVIYLAHPHAILNYAEKKADPGVFMVFRPTHVDLVIDDPNNIPDKAKRIAERLGEGEARLVKVIPDKEEQTQLFEEMALDPA